MRLSKMRIILKGLKNPDVSIGQVPASFDNFGDILVSQAMKDLFAELTIVECSPNMPFRILDSLLGLNKVFKYSSLRGGTLIFADASTGWLEELEYVVNRTVPLFTFGTGVIDPSLILHLDEPSIDTKLLSDKHNEHRAKWVQCLKKFNFITVRGLESKRLLEEHGLHTVHIIGDPALLYARPTIKPKLHNKTIGINISEYSHFWSNSQQNTVDELSKLMRILLRNGWRITLFSTIAEDIALARKIADSLDQTKLSLYETYRNTRDFLDRLECLDLFIGVKLHSAVAACCVYTPAIMVGYQPKCYDFMKTMSLDAYFVRSDHLNAEELFSKLMCMNDEIEAIQSAQFDACHTFRKEILTLRERVLRTIGAPI
jgi:hypothetical protein